MNDEIEEILGYLEKRNDYVIWAGFAAYAHLGIPHSPDIDIFTDTPETKIKIASDFQKRGWRRIPSYPQIEKLVKNETSLDIICSEAASNIFIPDAVEIEVLGHKARFLSREALFITKLLQTTWKKRSEEKRRRDLEAIGTLKKMVDRKKLKDIFSRLPYDFWTSGEE